MFMIDLRTDLDVAPEGTISTFHDLVQSVPELIVRQTRLRDLKSGSEKR